MPVVQAKLERGALAADVGCGHGKALIKLAQTYPQSCSSLALWWNSTLDPR
jgi:cyclopropane fatty-acyl-phospholipid synthase-like methyltransferase